MQPWEANGGPDADELRRLVRDGKTDREIGDTFGVTRQTVAYWRARAGISRGRGPLLSHKDTIPWTVSAVHHEDGIAKRLREYSTIKQGGQVTEETRRRVENFVNDLRELNRVITYTEKGFRTVTRDPKLDLPDDIIRRPR